MIKKEYMKPAIEVIEADLDQLILTMSVTTTGLDNDEDLEVDDSKTGNAWSDAW